MRRSALIAGVLAGVGAAPACAQETAERPAASEAESAAPAAEGSTTYDLVGADGTSIGRIELTDAARGVLLQVRAEGLAAGAHGLHVHETGICDPPFDSAGGHHDPEGRSHGFLSEDGPHAGDLPNLVVGEEQSLVVRDVWLRGTSLDVLEAGDGSAVVIHAGTDDYRTDPAGAAGDRVACAAIRAP